MFEDRTPEIILSECLAPMADRVQTREGSFAYELTAPVAMELYKIYQGLAALLPAIYVDAGSGGFIDLACARYGITRKPGAKAAASMTFRGAPGTRIPAGATFLSGSGLEFLLDSNVTISANGAGEGVVTAVEIGDAYNLPAGELTQMTVNLTGLNAWTSGEAQGGADEESDEALVGRLYDYWCKPATSGNVYDYQRWALEVDGVGAVKVLPLWNGPGTVKVLLCSPERRGVDAAVVSSAAGHIETLRPIGAAVTVESAGETAIDVNATLRLDGSVALAAVKAQLVSKLDTYLQGMAFENYTVLYNRIAFLVLDCDGVTDYTSLTVNGGTGNVEVPADKVPVVGTVTLT